MAISPLPALSSSPSVRRIPAPATIARDALYLCAGLPAGLVAFTVLVTGFSLALGLAITLVGIPLAVATLYAARFMGDAERWRAGWVLDAPITRTDRPWRGSLWSRTKASFIDAGAWRDALWGLMLLPLGTLGFTVAVTLWSSAAGLLTSPLWFWAVSDHDTPDDATLKFLNSAGVGPSAARVAAGLVLVGVAIAVCHALAGGTARAGRALLGH